MMMDTDSYKGDDDFERFLIEIDHPLGIWEIKSFLMGFMVAPEMVPHSVILDMLLFKDTEMEVVLQNEDEFRRFMEKFFSLWNHLTSYRMSKEVPPLAPVPTDLRDQECFFATVIRRAEITLFLDNLMEAGGEEYLENETFCDGVDLLEDAIDELDQIMMGLNPDNITELDEKRTIKFLSQSLKNWEKGYSKIAHVILPK